MKREIREQEIIDMADRVCGMAENFAQDLKKQHGVSREYALKLAWAGIRRAARECQERSQVADLARARARTVPAWGQSKAGW